MVRNGNIGLLFEGNVIFDHNIPASGEKKRQHIFYIIALTGPKMR